MWTAETRPTYDRTGLRYPTDVTDAEWRWIAKRVNLEALQP